MNARATARAALRWTPIALVLIAFLVLKAYAFVVHTSDEGIYFYGALRTSQGLVPYRDFFFAHPPLHLLVPALLFLLRGGFSLLLAKGVPILGAALQGLCAYLIVRRLLGPRPAGDLAPARPVPQWAATAAGLVAASALLFSDSLLKASSSATGINQASGLLALSALLLVYRRPFGAGLAAGAAVMTLLQAAPVAAVLGVGALLLGRRAAWRFALGFGALLLVLHAWFGLLTGGAFFDQVYAYHLAKVDRPGEGGRHLGFVLVDNWMLFSTAAVGAVVLLLQRQRRLALLACAAIVAQFVAMATRPRVFPFYFQPAFLPAAVLCGAAVQAITLALRRGLALRQRRLGLIVAAAALLLVTALPGPATSLLSPIRAGQLAGESRTYTWVDAPGIGGLNALVKALFWQEGARQAGHRYCAVTGYLWQRSLWLDTYPDMLKQLLELQNRARRHEIRDVSLFGDSTIVGLLAVETGLPVTGDFVDTNIERFRSGSVSVADVERLLQRSPSAIVLLNPASGIGALPEMKAIVKNHYIRAGRYISTNGVNHEMYVRPDGWKVHD